MSNLTHIKIMMATLIHRHTMGHAFIPTLSYIYTHSITLCYMPQSAQHIIQFSAASCSAPFSIARKTWWGGGHWERERYYNKRARRTETRIEYSYSYIRIQSINMNRRYIHSRWCEGAWWREGAGGGYGVVLCKADLLRGLPHIYIYVELSLHRLKLEFLLFLSFMFSLSLFLFSRREAVWWIVKIFSLYNVMSRTQLHVLHLKRQHKMTHLTRIHFLYKDI